MQLSVKQFPIRVGEVASAAAKPAAKGKAKAKVAAQQAAEPAPAAQLKDNTRMALWSWFWFAAGRWRCSSGACCREDRRPDGAGDGC